MSNDVKTKPDKDVSDSTPESGYMTNSSSWLQELSEDEKVEDPNELSEHTPYKKRKPTKVEAPAPPQSNKEFNLPSDRNKNTYQYLSCKYPPIDSQKAMDDYYVLYEKGQNIMMDLEQMIMPRRHELQRFGLAVLISENSEEKKHQARYDELKNEEIADVNVPHHTYLKKKLDYLHTKFKESPYYFTP